MPTTTCQLRLEAERATGLQKCADLSQRTGDLLRGLVRRQRWSVFCREALRSRRFGGNCLDDTEQVLPSGLQVTAHPTREQNLSKPSLAFDQRGCRLLNAFEKVLELRRI